MNTLLCLGFGYCAEALARRLGSTGNWHIMGTSRSRAGAEAITAKGFDGLEFDGQKISAQLARGLLQATHILNSIAPGNDSDRFLTDFGPILTPPGPLRWCGYLSTIGVYGDTGGAWVDEDAPPNPTHERAIRRLGAEQAWLDFGERTGTSVEVFRIAGIYGPGRNVLEDLKAGTARRIIKPGQVFNRIHAADIAQCLAAAMSTGRAGRIYNLTDDEPAPPQDVLLYAANLLGVAPPPPIPFEAAALSPMAASFYADNRRVRNDRIKRELAVSLIYPTYREGLAGLKADTAR